jgi:hypothetical protein
VSRTGVLALAASLAACGAGAPPSGAGPSDAGPSGAAPPDAAWPPGTVLAVDGAPISVDEVDLASAWIARIEPQAAGRQLRRLALANVALPRLVAELSAPEERARARAEAEAQLARLLDGGLAGPPGADGGLGTRFEGTWQELGIPLWGQAIDWPVGEWRLIEEPGRFVVARRLRSEDHLHPMALVLSLDAFAFPYLPQGFDLAAAAERHRLTIVDPAWREIVPELTQYRMGARVP